MFRFEPFVIAFRSAKTACNAPFLERKPTGEKRPSLRCIFFIASSALFTGCTQEMMDQRRVEPQEYAAFFADGIASRPIPEHAIAASRTARASTYVGQTPVGVPSPAVAQLDNADGFWNGRVDGKLVDSIPQRMLEATNLRSIIERGQVRFNVSCSPCHDTTGSGNGMVARRGFKYPPSYHTDRLRSQPLGYIFNVATYGRGEMPAYDDFISTEDRWAIAAYVRTLQFSQYAPKSDLAETDLQQLDDQGNNHRTEAP